MKLPIYFYHPTVTEKDLAVDPVRFNTKSALDSWLVPVWLTLANAGYDVRFGKNPPSNGIVVASSYTIGRIKWGKDVYLVSMLADGYIHPRADFTVVQNLEQAAFCDNFACMPHWPELRLIPRAISRGNKIETMVYFGDPANLDQDCRTETFATTLQNSTGVHLKIQHPSRWHDYSDVDLVLALRTANNDVWQGCKPATKLYNAWLAGSPLIGGYESAFQMAASPGFDFLAVKDSSAVLEAVKILTNQPSLYAALRARSHEAAKLYNIEHLSMRWTRLFDERIIPLAISGRTSTLRSKTLGWIYAAAYRWRRNRS